jgi:hypothetical protein
LQGAHSFFVDRKDSPVFVADDAQVLDQGLHPDQAVGHFGPFGVAHEAVEGVHVQGAEENVPQEVLGGGEAARRGLAPGDEPEDVVGFEVPLGEQHLRHLRVLDPAPAQLL